MDSHHFQINSDPEYIWKCWNRFRNVFCPKTKMNALFFLFPPSASGILIFQCESMQHQCILLHFSSKSTQISDCISTACVCTVYGNVCKLHLLCCPSFTMLISHATARCPDTHKPFQPHFSFSNQLLPQSVIAVSACRRCFKSRSSDCNKKEMAAWIFPGKTNAFTHT